MKVKMKRAIFKQKEDQSKTKHVGVVASTRVCFIMFRTFKLHPNQAKTKAVKLWGFLLSGLCTDVSMYKHRHVFLPFKETNIRIKKLLERLNVDSLKSFQIRCFCVFQLTAFLKESFILLILVQIILYWLGLSKRHLAMNR